MASSSAPPPPPPMSSFRINLLFVWLLLVLLSCFVRDITGTVHFGLESPIELIEEWGCQDVPIRLTCPKLDSKIVVLEATFSPNCTDSKNCHVFDSNGRLTRVFLKHSRHDYRLQETAAGRRFLQTLRKSQEDYKERIHEEEGEHVSSAEGEELNPPSSSSPIAAYRDFKTTPGQHRASLWDTVDSEDTIVLKSSLEKLIVEYLKKLSPDEDFEAEEYSRLRRHLMDIIEPTIDNGDESVVGGDDGASVGVDRMEEDVDSNEGGDDEGEYSYASNEIVTENVSQVYNNTDSEFVTSSGEVEKGRTRPGRGRKRGSKKCVHSRRVVTSLNAMDIDRAQQNETEKEYNIRRIINYRCSGKNHCNFLFEQDHPFSLIWRSGIVRIKYACMNEFRITRYCGEILPIGNERHVTYDPSAKDTSGLIEPIVAARMQMLNDQNFHQFTNLKIIKPDEVEPPKRRKLSPPKKIKPEEKELNKDPSIYSQDFRTLKILPADNPLDFNEIELIGEDFYFGNKLQNEDEHSHAPATTTAGAEVDPSSILIDNYARKDQTTPELMTVTHSMIDNNEIIELDENNNNNHTVAIDLENKNFEDDLNNLLGNIQRSRTTPAGTDEEQYLEQLVSAVPDHGDVDEDVNTGGKLLLGSEDYSEDVFEDEEEDDEYYYDDEYELQHRNKGPRKYKSIARTQLRKALLQGFIMSPGYPKFYIGEMECRYIIKAPKNTQVRITLFDVSLRSDLPCRDFMDVEDVVQQRSLYSGCQEQTKPLTLVTGSHIARIKLTTTTKTAYPKRGILIHYQAVGCVQPELPKNVVLVEFNQEEGSLRVSCQHPDFVFPDTNYPERMLRCSPTHVAWDRTIPSCIEVEQASGSGLVSHLNSELLLSSDSSRGAATSGAAMNKPADVVVDVIVPCVIIGALFLVNGLVFMMIMKRRNQRTADNSPRELEDL